jgi:hypothetical protein
MSIDPTIPLRVNTPEAPNPFQTIGQILGIRQAQNQLAGQDREAAHAEQERQAEARLRDLFSRGEMPPPEAIIGAVGMERGLDIVKGIQALDQLANKRVTDQRDTAGRLALGMKRLPPALRAEWWPGVRKAAIAGGLGDEHMMPPEATDEFLDAVVDWASGKATEPQKPTIVNPGDTALDPVTHQPIYTAPTKVPDTPSRPVNFRVGGRDVAGDYVPGAGGKPGRYFYQGRDVTDRVEQTPRASRGAQVPKPTTLSPAQRAVAARTKGRDLYAADRDFRRELDQQQIPRTGRRSPDEQAAYDEALQTLWDRKLEVENTYRAELGLDPIDELGPEWNRPAQVRRATTPALDTTAPAPRSTPAAAPQSPAPATPSPVRFTDPTMRQKARETLAGNGFDTSDAAVDAFLSKPTNRAKLGFK